MLKKSILIWVLFIPLGILNGGFREMYLMTWAPENYALPMSGIILCLSIFLVSYVLIPRIGKGEPEIYLKMGVLWVVLTILVETMLGFAMGNTLTELLKAYDVMTGNFWLLVVLFVGIVPWTVVKIKEKIDRRSDGLYIKEME